MLDSAGASFGDRPYAVTVWVHRARCCSVLAGGDVQVCGSVCVAVALTSSFAAAQPAGASQPAVPPCGEP